MDVRNANSESGESAKKTALEARDHALSRENRGAKAKAEAEAEVNVGGDNGGGRGGKGDDSPRLPSMRRRFVRRLAEAMENPCRVRRGATLLLAVSGGADSLALLAGLTAIARKPHRDYRLHVACVHHHLRDEADAEAEAVEHLAAALGLPFHRRDIHPANAPGNLEANARRDRYDALFEIARSVKAEAIVTGQHGTDQIETILLALARGAGLVGLAGMNWRSDLGPVAILRPLLNQSHENCVELCRSIGWTWFEDPSNRDESRSRNLIRSRILPVLREIAPDLETRIHRTTDLLEAAAEHFEAEAARARQEIEKRLRTRKRRLPARGVV